MTPEVAREMIPILEAIERGALVERRCKGENWEPQVGTMILNDDWEFRIKPQPREFWVAWEDDDTEDCAVYTEKEGPPKLSYWDRIIKVREVLNEEM